MIAFRPFAVLIILFALAVPAARAENVWDITGPIDPNYAIDATTPPAPALAAEEYAEGEIPFTPETFAGRASAEAALADFAANENNPAELYDSRCHAKLRTIAAQMAARGYEISTVTTEYSEGGYRNFQGQYARVIQTVRVTFVDRLGKRPALRDASSCKTRSFRWL